MKIKNLVVGTCATQRYNYALPSFGRRLVASIYESRISKGHFVFAGDHSDTIEESYNKYIVDLLPKGWTSELIKVDVVDKDLKNYKEDAQFLIAKLQSVLFHEARKRDADYFWSLESDVLVSPNSLRVCLDSLNYDNGYYDVCMCTYPSQGGGSYLGGFGDYGHHINEDFMIEERDVPKNILSKYNKLKDRLDDPKSKKSQKLVDDFHNVREEIKKYPPKENIFTLNGKKWRRRGWMEYAYPGIGKGALLPTDWVGFGCTMMSRKALALAHFDGYQGKGTQDLYICWHNWHPNDIKLCVSTHSICDHVIRKREGDEQVWKDFIHVRAFHEPEGEYRGHLRQENLPYVSHV